MPDDYTDLLGLLQVLAENGVKFEVKGGDTVYLVNLDEKTGKILAAVLEADPDEAGWEEGKFRLWWD